MGSGYQTTASGLLRRDWALRLPMERRLRRRASVHPSAAATNQGGKVQAVSRNTGVIAALIFAVSIVGCSKKDNYSADTAAAVTDTTSTSTMTASSTAPMAQDTTAAATTTSKTTAKKSTTKKTTAKKSTY